MPVSIGDNSEQRQGGRKGGNNEPFSNARYHSEFSFAGAGPGRAVGPAQAARHLRRGQCRGRHQPATEGKLLDHDCAVGRLFQYPLPGSLGGPGDFRAYSSGALGHPQPQSTGRGEPLLLELRRRRLHAGCGLECPKSKCDSEDGSAHRDTRLSNAPMDAE